MLGKTILFILQKLTPPTSKRRLAPPSEASKSAPRASASPRRGASASPRSWRAAGVRFCPASRLETLSRENLRFPKGNPQPQHPLHLLLPVFSAPDGDAGLGLTGRTGAHTPSHGLLADLSVAAGHRKRRGAINRLLRFQRTPTLRRRAKLSSDSMEGLPESI